ncbi:Cyanogenic beta-glucosidase [Bienertia sinuspersici]
MIILFKDDSKDYAELCYKEFGDKVKRMNHLYYDTSGYAAGNAPPGRCSKWQHLYLNCTAGDSGTEPYIV